MPLDVIMPALGMAQDSGHIVAWHKSQGDQVAEGDVLFEVETDKATMEVEAQGAGYLTDVTAGAGAEVPVGQVIARISDTAEGQGDSEPPAASAPTPEKSEETRELPDGQPVIMPTLGMAQDTGLLVNWLKGPGDKVVDDDILFEVETDKSTIEMPAGTSGYLAALLAQPGEDVPVGQTIAIVTKDPPETTISRSVKDDPAAAAATSAAAVQDPPSPASSAPMESPARASTAPAPAAKGRILASPKARRLALEQGLDLSRLAVAGYPQPYHVKDIETLKSLPVPQAVARAGDVAFQITASARSGPHVAFLEWAEVETGANLTVGAIRAAFAAGALRETGAMFGSLLIEYAPVHGPSYTFSDPDIAPLSTLVAAEADTAPDLRLRDLTASPVTGLRLGAPECPTLTVATEGDTLALTLDFTAAQLSETAALSLIAEFAGRLEDPLRHLL